ncbi:hypothetical protein T05_12497 [Trichinella murrelli]|uniref:Uncharacterized protein n=1 Tax=Trichinella murrelli TaxID=144512 RepID=A0A0V0TV28_9BILA|nr:hypothetical protein T05_12497 [Trichinella murrelli]
MDAEIDSVIINTGVSGSKLMKQELIQFFNITISWLPWYSVYKFRNGLFPRYRCIAHLAHVLKRLYRIAEKFL